MFNIGLLIKTLSIQTKSYDDADMIEYITRFLKKNKLKFKKDSYGNIYVTKGKADVYPCVVSHMDTVHSKVNKEDFKIFKSNNILFAMDMSKGKQVGIGGDDKAGVYVTLQTLLDRDTVKAVFYRNEEVGRLGSKESMKTKKKFYNDCSFVLQCDRKGNSDFITTSGGIKMVNDKFMNDVSPILSKYGFKEAVGIATDVDILVREKVGVCCANLSSGYHRPHSDSEIVIIDELKTTYELVLDIIDTLGNTVYDYIYKAPVYKYSNYSNTYNYSRVNSEDKIFYEGIVHPFVFNKTVPSEFKKFNKIEYSYERLSRDTEYELNNMYSLIPMKNNVCAYCDTEDSIVYYPAKETFMCKNCGDFKSYSKDDLDETPTLFKNLKIVEDNTTFVYNRLSKCWLKKDKTYWSTISSTYQPVAYLS